MTYQTRNPEAACHPLRSIPLLRPMPCLGAAFVQQRTPPAVQQHQQATRTLELARYALEDALSADADARAYLGQLNRRRRRDRHDREITPDRVLARLVREHFGVMNRRRGALVRARKAVAAAEAALLALAG